MADTENPSGGHTNSGSGHQHVSQPNINVTLGGTGVKAIVGALIGVAIILLLTVPVAKGADQKAINTETNEQRFEDRVNKRADVSDQEVRQLAYWATQAETRCMAAGVKMPPLPGMK